MMLPQLVILAALLFWFSPDVSHYSDKPGPKGPLCCAPIASRKPRLSTQGYHSPKNNRYDLARNG
jgi:hypothetical protein